MRNSQTRPERNRVEMIEMHCINAINGKHVNIQYLPQEFVHPCLFTFLPWWLVFLYLCQPRQWVFSETRLSIQSQSSVNNSIPLRWAIHIIHHSTLYYSSWSWIIFTSPLSYDQIMTRDWLNYTSINDQIWILIKICNVSELNDVSWQSKCPSSSILRI